MRWDESCQTQRETDSEDESKVVFSCFVPQVVSDLRVNYIRRVQGNRKETESIEVEMLEDGEKHKDVASQQAGEYEILNIMTDINTVNEQMT